jgi:hypothetical protein
MWPRSAGKKNRGRPFRAQPRFRPAENSPRDLWPVYFFFFLEPRKRVSPTIVIGAATSKPAYSNCSSQNAVFEPTHWIEDCGRLTGAEVIEIFISIPFKHIDEPVAENLGRKKLWTSIAQEMGF